MTSWTNATDRCLSENAGYAKSTGRGEMVHPQAQDLLLQRDRLSITDPALAPYADWFWSVRWTRHGQPLRTSEVITNPVCHLTFEQGSRTGGDPLVRHNIRLPAAV
ncbi:MAG: hypothetical protein M3Y77_01065, partial [Actinomycetota bacterium]|nr:hypothetical protein [Actinomycetota bacterium]